MRESFNIDKLRFSQRQRLTYIEAIAYWEGAIDRPRVSSAFKISENHVTKDFRLYKDAFPENLQYDESERVYRPTKQFRHRIGRGSADEYLSLLRAHAEQRDGGLLPASAIAVVTDAVPIPKGTVDGVILNRITRAITSGTGMEVSYQSKNREVPALRKIWPHALLFGGTRWHARAYDEERNQFIDLVLQRILSAKPIQLPRPQSVNQDKEWKTMVNIDVIPRRSFSPSQAEVVAREFGMVRKGRQWMWSARLRECLAGYFIYLHRLDLDTEQDTERVIELRDPSLADLYLPSRSRGLRTKSAKATG